MRQIHQIFVSLFLIVCLSINCNAQTNKKSTLKKKEVLEVIEIDPEFPGGEEARQKFLRDNVVYPVEARKNNIQGVVYVDFVIEPDGTVSNIEIYKSVQKSLDEEAIRVTSLMPKWIPGTQRGKPIRVKYRMPIRFTLDDGNDTSSKSSKKKNK
jgi:TonB family protein